MTDIRIFQIIVPLITLIFMGTSFTRYRKGRLTLGELILALIFWLAIGVFSIFPDLISRKIAGLFGIKDNVNAVIFFGLGVLLFIQLRLYNLYKQQQKDLTRLSRDLALRDYHKNQE